MADVFRIFLASPGDVQDERNLARAVIDQVRNERAFRGRIDIEVVACDQPGAAVAMDVGLTPQEAIARGLPKPSECDLVVVILWSRMGTPLPDEYRKADGSPFLSGTEWEYEDAMGAATRPERPAVWVYRRMQTPAPELEDPNYSEIVEQWAKVKSFFEKFTHSDGSLKGVHFFETPDEFRKAFEAHLRDCLVQKVESLLGPEAESPVAVTAKGDSTLQWKGSPYPGLEAFNPEQAAIFFGRTRETDRLIELLRDPTLRFLAVLGASGSGKSSLVAAGLIPRLRGGALPGSDQWVDLSFKPGERADRDGNCPFLSLARALKPALEGKGYRPADLAHDLRSKPDRVFDLAREALDGRPSDSQLIVFIDQFEELFTLVADADRQKGFISLLGTVVEKPGSRVRTIATMRSDFTERVAETPELAGLFQGKGLFLLAAPGERALEEMILRPARVAGVKVPDALCERILTDTGTGPGALALMAFTLNELYNHGRTETGSLSLDFYEKTLGGVQGAIDRQAEAAIGRLGRGRRFDEGALHDLFFDLVGVNDHGVATRRRVSRASIGANPAKEILAETLVEARVLVTDHETESICEVAHEAIFTGWKRLSKWIENNGDAMRMCRKLRMAAREWSQKGSPAFSYLPDTALLRDYLKTKAKCRFEETDAHAVGRYLATAKRRRLTSWVFLTVFFFTVSTLGVNGWRLNRDMTWNAVRIWVLLRMGKYQPPMVTVPGGCYEMGCGTICISGESPGGEVCLEDPDCMSNESPERRVCVEEFEVGEFEVTQDLWTAVMGNNPSSRNHIGGNHPVDSVNWNQVKDFIDGLNYLTKQRYRLPTEAEWEYAARDGGKERPMISPAFIKEHCQCCNSNSEKTYPVGQKTPNALGIYDMCGNVYEWVEDDYHHNYDEGPWCGTAWIDHPRSSDRVCRGGSIHSVELDLRTTYRTGQDENTGSSALGFRLAKSIRPHHQSAPSCVRAWTM